MIFLKVPRYGLSIRIQGEMKGVTYEQVVQKLGYGLAGFGLDKDWSRLRL